MTVGELINELQKLDAELLIIRNDSEDYANTPTLNIRTNPYQTPYYWGADNHIHIIPKNTPFVTIT